MGIRGLTTYIAQHADQFLEQYELHDCQLVIDGNSLASVLYNWHSNCPSAFGGDYDKYAMCVSNFFESLLQACISPIVIFDGGYETRKLGTVMYRLQKKILTAKNVTPTSKSQLFPLLMKEVFKDVLCKYRIPFAQCFFEADGEIAAIARLLKCPVLSYDSDFYIYDVLYIPCSTVNVDAQKKENNLGVEPIYYIACSIYNIDHFLKRFGGLSKSLVPLMATLLGNDYIKRGTFKNFFSNIKSVKNSTNQGTQKKIASLLAWLQNESLDSAIEKVLVTVKKQYRNNVREKILLNTINYTKCSSNLLSVLDLPVEVNRQTVQVPEVSNDSFLCNQTTLDLSDNDGSSEDNHDDNVSSDSSDEELEHRGENLGECKTSKELEFVQSVENLPDWFKDNFRKGNFPTYFIDIVTQHTYFCSPQVEDYTLPFSHAISLPIIGAIYGLLLNGNVKSPLLYYSRNTHSCPEKQLLNISENRVSQSWPSLDQVAEWQTVEQESFLFKIVEISAEDRKVIQEFPTDWQLFIVALVYWVRNCKSPCISNCHVHALLIGIVALSVIDEKIGYQRTKKELTTFAVRHSKGAIKEDNTAQTIASSLQHTISDFLQIVSNDDCIHVAEVLLPYHSVADRLKVQVKHYSVLTVHAFAQFQSVLCHIMHLNSLLHFPLRQCKPASFFSGTFVYNMYINLKRRVDIMPYINLILSCGPSVNSLYTVLAQSVLQLMPGFNALPRKKKRVREAKPRKREGTSNIKCENERKSDSDTETYNDMCNKFYTLNTCND